MSLLAYGTLVGQETFSKVYSFDGVGSIKPIPGSRDWLVCHTTRYYLDLIDGFSFIRIDSAGSIVSRYDYSTGPLENVMQDGAFSMPRSDGTFSFLFGNHTLNPLKFSVRIFNTTADGVMNWNRKIEFAESDQDIRYLFPNQAFLEAPDGGYILSATRGSHNGGLWPLLAPLVVKLDEFGNTIWNKSYHLEDSCTWKGFCTVGATGEILMGFNTGPYCPPTSTITKIDSNGETIWSKRIAGLQAHMSDCVRQSDGYLIVASDTNSFRFVKIDSAGELAWARSYALSSASFWGGGNVRATRTYDDGVVVSSGILGSGVDSDVLLFKIDVDGSVVWIDYFNDSSVEMPNDVVQDQDSTIIQLSWAEPVDSWRQQYIRRIRSDGFSDCIWDTGPNLIEQELEVELVEVTLNEYEASLLSRPLYVGDSSSWETSGGVPVCYLGAEELDPRKQLSIRPNPFVETAVLDLGRDVRNADFVVHNILGVEVRRQKINSRYTVISRAGLANGIYLFRAVNNGQSLGSGKMIIE